jgi:endonuclease/exonuclease/phosphatase family metal-dependent hydrolase
VLLLASRLRRICVAIGLAALAGAFALRVRARSTGGPLLLPHEVSPVRVLTWNVGKIYLGTHGDSRPADADLKHIAAVIRETGPDLVALQEMRDRAQLDLLLAHLRGAYVGYVPDEEINDRRTAVLAKNRPDVAFAQIVTSTGRAAAVARVTLGNRQLSFVSVHLDAFNPRLRATQAEEIVDWTGRNDDRELILAGDFNFDADFLTNHEPLHSDAEIYRLLTAHFEDAASGGRGTTIVDRRLDYLFSRGRLRRRLVQVMDHKVGAMMDHVPVLVDYDLAPPAL